MDWKIIILFLIVTFNSYSQTIEDKELITFLYHNAEKIDIEDGEFDNILSEWDFRNLYLSKMIKITFGDNDTTARKLKILEKIKDSFYKHALNEVKNEYRTYNNISGPYFVYLVEKKDKEVKGILEKIIADTTMRHDNREELKSFLKKYNTYYYINGKKRNIEIKKEANSSSYTISKIRNGEEVRVVEDEDDWLLIITTDGIKGYIHKNNIKIEIIQ